MPIMGFQQQGISMTRFLVIWRKRFCVVPLCT